CQQHYSRPLTF
nr:immunoglobulin light chain junction region [Macaca mulatta]MOV92763.1 immunoglobulin light chain junction region [Macaca mulatta]MOV92787.1 immunoglobulin light chain junction region [Macaca mulatta]MOV93296.1 immunoglobulin light chain junction region [Macaca mulatta]MOV93565.1 immunoglobulin light chain junction region [Macaca mulatta]